jgi:hypothetical protein
MARWLVVQLDSGRLANGSRLFATSATQQLWRVVTPMPIPATPPSLAAIRPNFFGYALGFQVQDYRGHKMISHTGGLPGMVSREAMIPDQRLGVVVLTNQESRGAFQAIVHRLIDHYLGAPPIDYVAIYEGIEATDDSTAAATVRSAATARDSASGPSLPLASYAGTYTDAWYGDVTITVEQGKLVLRFSHSPQLTGDLLHWQHDTFVARWRDRELRADAYITFSLRPDGHIDHAVMNAVSPDTDFSYDFQDLWLERK